MRGDGRGLAGRRGAGGRGDPRAGRDAARAAQGGGGARAPAPRRGRGVVPRRAALDAGALQEAGAALRARVRGVAGLIERFSAPRWSRLHTLLVPRRV